MREELAQARRATDGDARQRGPQGPDRPEPPAATGHALDGRVQVTVTAGRVSDVTLDPRALRAPSEDLAAAIREAVNAAIEAHNAQAVAGVPDVPPLPDLTRMLDEVSDASRRAMEEAGEGMRDALAAVQRVSELHRRRPPGWAG
ncbi:hypothetical protein GCM10023317_69330 [Actinopolymorpha pittospori]